MSFLAKNLIRSSFLPGSEVIHFNPHGRGVEEHKSIQFHFTFNAQHALSFYFEMQIPNLGGIKG